VIAYHNLQSRILLPAQRPGDVVAEYYQQQLEMLEGFNEMDTLTDRGCLPGLSKVCSMKTSFLADKLCYETLSK
jgi:hypothetical protein